MTDKPAATSWARPGGLSEFVVFAPGEGRLCSGETFAMDAQAARNVIASFNGDKFDRVVDYDHQSIDPQARGADGLAPAAGWISGLSWDPARGLVAAVTWTERGEQLVASGHYRFHSPVFYRDRAGRVSELCSVGLTNSPAILDSRPLAASRSMDLARCAIGESQRLICSTTGELNMPLTTICQSNPQLANDDGDQRPQFNLEDEDRIADAGMILAAALEKVDELVNTNNTSLGEVARLFDHVGKDGMKRLRMLAHHAEQEQRRQTGEELLEQVGRTAASRQHAGSASILAAQWGREFEADLALRSEFTTRESYIAYKRADAMGLVRIVGARRMKATAPPRSSTAGASPGLTVAALKQLYEATPALQEEFGELATFIAFKKHEQAGHVQILGGKR
ncbi:MAG TPA: phage protease [Phycisphaerae bacterium]|nr:phage protease [Phycisphaerae bacterium]